MADIRIKDLTTTASSTASDDFIAVDGTTNGTRKLSAFSPTFGGNATVTGTLTANGLLTAAATTSLDGLPTAAIFGATKRIAIGYNTSGDYGFVASADSGTTWKELHLNPVGGIVKVPNTSSSTTTSSGALVVGNGTSGGLGVGGAINAGGAITSNNGSGSGLLGMRSSSGNASYVFWSETSVADRGILGFNNGSSTLSYRSGASSFSTGTEVFSISSAGNTTIAGTLSVADGGTASSAGTIRLSNNTSIGWRNAANSADIFLTVNNSNIFSFGSGAPVYVNNTTASTSTSSGALVVSGGVGVAGKVNATSVGVANTSQSVAAWGDVGIQLSVAGAVLTDTSSSGTVARIVTNSIASSALAASSTTTYTAAATLFIAGGPTANTNVTITNAYAIYTAAGRINFQGLPTSSAGLQAGTLWNDGGTLKVA